jgi:hypothetical protein
VSDMSDEDKDDFIKFIINWARNFMNQHGPSEEFHLEREDTFRDWSKRVLSYYDKEESGIGRDETVAFIEKVISDVISYADEEASSKNKKSKDDSRHF